MLNVLGLSSVAVVLVLLQVFAIMRRAESFLQRTTAHNTCSRGVTNTHAVSSSKLGMSTSDTFALLFDCDGVIVETEELHRLAYNAAFDEYGLQLPDGSPVVWDVAYYDILQNTVGGGKPKMHYYFNEEVKAWPSSTTAFLGPPRTKRDQESLVNLLQDKKTEVYKQLLEDVATARPGVLELMDEAIRNPNIKVGLCSAATKAGFEKVVDTLVGRDRLAQLDVVMAGDDVSKKKPHPMIYNKAQDILQLPSDRCVVIEDSMVGLRAAKAADMRCIITYTDSTAKEDFYGEGADAKVPNLAGVTLIDIFAPLQQAAATNSWAVVDLLPTKRDPLTAAPSGAGSGRGAAVGAYKGWTPHKLLSAV